MADERTKEQEPVFCRVERVEKLTGRKRRTLYRWAKEGKIPAPVNGLWDFEGVKERIQSRMRAGIGIPCDLETDP